MKGRGSYQDKKAGESTAKILEVLGHSGRPLNFNELQKVTELSTRTLSKRLEELCQARYLVTSLNDLRFGLLRRKELSRSLLCQEDLAGKEGRAYLRRLRRLIGPNGPWFDAVKIQGPDGISYFVTLENDPIEDEPLRKLFSDEELSHMVRLSIEGIPRHDILFSLDHNYDIDTPLTYSPYSVQTQLLLPSNQYDLSPSSPKRLRMLDRYVTEAAPWLNDPKAYRDVLKQFWDALHWRSLSLSRPS